MARFLFGVDAEGSEEVGETDNPASRLVEAG
jgi:hypothetical protein